MQILTGLLGSTLLFCPVQGALNLFPGTERTFTQQQFGFSDQCLEALNQTVLCDAQAAGKVATDPDTYHWTQEELTAICTEECSKSVSSWKEEVDNRCRGNRVAESFSTAWVERQRLVCLQDSASDFCLLESYDWQGSNYIRYSHWMCYNADDADNPPECDDPNFSTAFIPPDFKKVTTLYGYSMLCSECFIMLWRERLLSSSLPDSEHTDYLFEQYDIIQEYCSIDWPVPRRKKAHRSEPTRTTTTSDAGHSASAKPQLLPSTCHGQLVHPGDPEEVPPTCIGLADAYNVSIGTLDHITGYNGMCHFDTPICLPPPCDIDMFYGNPTCEELAAKYSTPERPVSLVQFLAWNPHIQGQCDFLNHVQHVCKGPPGGYFKPTGSIVVAPTASTIAGETTFDS
ncbi:hypothetical protein BDV06DRAFT_218899 [Aspergillus oleicola]